MFCLLLLAHLKCCTILELGCLWGLSFYHWPQLCSLSPSSCGGREDINFNIHHRKIERHLLSDEKNGDHLGISEQFLLMKCAVSFALF